MKFTVMLSESAYRTVDALADWTDGSMADVIRDAVGIFWWLAKE